MPSTIEPKKTEATKFDKDKVPLELLPIRSIYEVGKVLRFGKNKYGINNWRKGMEISRMLGAVIRHVFKYLCGVDNDEESGLSHLAHASCCVLMALEYILTNTGTDDRFKYQHTFLEE